MNKIKLITLSLLLATVVLFPGCGGGSDDPGSSNNNTEQMRVLGLMKSGTWKVQSLTVDGADHTASFANMTLNFTDAAYSTSNGKQVWPSTGTWQFASGSASSFTRNDGTTVTIDAITESAMTLSMNWSTTTIAGGRVEGIKGKNVFVFSK